MNTKTFKLKSRIDELDVRSYSVLAAQQAYLDPTNTLAYYEGEWVTFASDGKTVQRATANTAPAYLMFNEPGAFDAQVIPGKKIPVILGPEFEAETTLFTATGVVAGTPLCVGTATVDGSTRTVLKKWTASAASGAHIDYIVGYARYISGTWLRYRGVPNFPVYYVV